MTGTGAGAALGGPVRVVLADDHPIWRDGVRADLGAGFSVVAEAGSADEAIAAVREHRPDLVVCDLHMPGGGGIKVARTCGEETRIVMLTVSEAERDLLDAVAAGAVGYLVKSTPGPELRAALVRAAGGEPVFSLTGHAGGVLLALGIGRHLVAAGVGAPEPYVVPLAAQLLVAGAQARRRSAVSPKPGPSLESGLPYGRSSGLSPVSSWVAYGPAVALLGGVALAERLGGGAGWHALVAGAVGVTAVAAGGMWRLAGPLVLGTGLLVVVTAHESLTALAGVPTWAWLAAGGSFLLATGVALERSDTSPVEAGRRVVDVLSERFA